MGLKFEKFLSHAVVFSMVVAVFVVAGLCIFADKAHTREIQMLHEPEVPEHSREIHLKLSKFLWKIVGRAEKFPRLGFGFSDKNISEDVKFAEISSVCFGFAYYENPKNQADDVTMISMYGCPGSGKGETVSLIEIDTLKKEVWMFLNAKVPLKKISKHIKNLDLEIKEILRQKNLLDKHGEIQSSTIQFAGKNREFLRNSHWLGGVRSEEEWSAVCEKAQKIGDFHTEIFRGNVWLVREIRGNSSVKWVQGFLLNKERLQAALNEEIAGTGFCVEFPSNAYSANAAPAGFPLLILPENVSADGILLGTVSVFRVFSVGVFLFVLSVCLVTLFAFFYMRETASRERLFAAAIAHDLRSPLVSLETQNEKLAEICSGNEVLADGILKQKTGLENLLKRIENLLLFSKVSRGNAKFAGTEKTFVEILEPIASQIAARLEEGGIDFETKISEEAKSARVQIAPEALEHILTNLADNAAKYAVVARGNTLVFSISAEIEGKNLRIFIADNGNGIVPEARERLFDEFSRVKSENMKNGRFGLGIGLALARKLSRLNAGELFVERTNDTGTIFVLKLKLKKR